MRIPENVFLTITISTLSKSYQSENLDAHKFITQLKCWKNEDSKKISLLLILMKDPEKTKFQYIIVPILNIIEKFKLKKKSYLQNPHSKTKQNQSSRKQFPGT